MIALGIFIFVVFLFSYLRKRSTREQREAQEQFWQRENEANHTRRQDISGLPYINIPLEQFPVGIFEDDALKEDEKKLLALSEKKILNLGGITNTELKLLYGAANLPATVAQYNTDCAAGKDMIRTFPCSAAPSSPTPEPSSLSGERRKRRPSWNSASPAAPTQAATTGCWQSSTGNRE